MSPYIVSFFRNRGRDVNQSQFYAILPLIVLVSTIFFPIGMSSASKFGSRKTILTGAVILVASVFIVSVYTHPVTFFIIYAGGFGIGKGFLYPAPLKASWSHLPGRKGLVSGTIVSGLGLGAFIYGIVVNKLVNPDNLVPEEVEIEPGVTEYVFNKEVTDRVPKMLMILATCWAT